MKQKKPEKASNVKQKPVERENEDEDEEEDDDDDEEEKEEEDNHDNNNTLIPARTGRNILDCAVCHKPLKILDCFLQNILHL